MIFHLNGLESHRLSRGRGFAWTGQWHDRETGLYYNWHRYYDPKTGRYISIDPLGLSGSGSLYGYAGNNPLSFTDPTGLWVPVYNPNGNRIGVTMEPGDKLSDLTDQLGVSYEEFAQRHSVNNIFFDITDYVLKSQDFAGDITGMNCFSSTLAGTGLQTPEIEIKAGGFARGLVDMYGAVEISNPHAGDMITWTDKYGITNHAAIYALKDSRGTEYYFGRPGLNWQLEMQNSRHTKKIYRGLDIDYFRSPKP